ncbi:DUF3899 domain-containing protein [Sporosarcina sp. ACRSL]|uniref:DUF3899 domain-containing protein n=1 Tax=Sporosarcina sp. ACRSL TaxID=2918215 RepID=UPI001EF60F38|nr:DUF3899 domain-containing protein [Sporosarcina sp. ACRSL]MCG7345382.1 DUF3899 domain-containing protein [Sporosarcina sp. ACRSL]
MKNLVKNIIVNQLLILVVVLIFYRKLTILDYINVSFYIGASYLFFGILILIFQSGFFDFFSTSIKKVFYRKYAQSEITNMRAPSEVVTLKSSFFFRSGLPIILLMFVALFFYSI